VLHLPPFNIQNQSGSWKTPRGRGGGGAPACAPRLLARGERTAATHLGRAGHGLGAAV
jgi:hypothetical protein